MISTEVTFTFMSLRYDMARSRITDKNIFFLSLCMEYGILFLNY